MQKRVNAKPPGSKGTATRVTPATPDAIRLMCPVIVALVATLHARGIDLRYALKCLCEPGQ